MIYSIQNDQAFQVLASSFTIGPSATGYKLQVSADGDNFADLFQVGANITRMVTGIACGSYFRLYGNQGIVSVNWEKGSNGDSGEGGGGSSEPSESDILFAQSTFPVGTPLGSVVAIAGKQINNWPQTVAEGEEILMVKTENSQVITYNTSFGSYTIGFMADGSIGGLDPEIPYTVYTPPYQTEDIIYHFGYDGQKWFGIRYNAEVRSAYFSLFPQGKELGLKILSASTQEPNGEVYYQTNEKQDEYITPYGIFQETNDGWTEVGGTFSKGIEPIGNEVYNCGPIQDGAVISVVHETEMPNIAIDMSEVPDAGNIVNHLHMVTKDPVWAEVGQLVFDFEWLGSHLKMYTENKSGGEPQLRPKLQSSGSDYEQDCSPISLYTTEKVEITWVSEGETQILTSDYDADSGDLNFTFYRDIMMESRADAVYSEGSMTVKEYDVQQMRNGKFVSLSSNGGSAILIDLDNQNADVIRALYEELNGNHPESIFGKYVIRYDNGNGYGYGYYIPVSYNDTCLTCCMSYRGYGSEIGFTQFLVTSDGNLIRWDGGPIMRYDSQLAKIKFDSKPAGDVWTYKVWGVDEWGYSDTVPSVRVNYPDGSGYVDFFADGYAERLHICIEGKLDDMFYGWDGTKNWEVDGNLYVATYLEDERKMMFQTSVELSDLTETIERANTEQAGEKGPWYASSVEGLEHLSYSPDHIVNLDGAIAKLSDGVKVVNGKCVNTYDDKVNSPYHFKSAPALPSEAEDGDICIYQGHIYSYNGGWFNLI